MSSRRYVFQKTHLAVDLQVLRSTAWSCALDHGQCAAVVALHIKGAIN